MIDFFTALLEPHSTASPPLQPRLPALFEPLAPRADAAEFGEASTANDGDLHEPERTSPRRPGRTAPPERGQERAPYRGVMTVSPTPRTEESLAPPDSPEVAPRAAPSRDAAVDSPRPEQLVTGERVPERRAALSRAQASRAEGESSPGAIRPAPPPEPRVAEPRPGAEPQGAVAPPPPPPVRIEIGRIVVRAVRPGEERLSPRAAAPAKKLSLDDYLEKRERGER